MINIYFFKIFSQIIDLLTLLTIVLSGTSKSIIQPAETTQLLPILHHFSKTTLEQIQQFEPIINSFTVYPDSFINKFFRLNT